MNVGESKKPTEFLNYGQNTNRLCRAPSLKMVNITKWRILKVCKSSSNIIMSIIPIYRHQLCESFHYQNEMKRLKQYVGFKKFTMPYK